MLRSELTPWMAPRIVQGSSHRIIGIILHPGKGEETL